MGRVPRALAVATSLVPVPQVGGTAVLRTSC